MRSLRRMGPYVRPYALISFLLVFTVVLPVAMELAVPRALAYVIDQGIVPGNMTAIMRGTVAMLILALAGAAATLGQGACRALLSQGLAYDLRNVLFGHIQSFSFANLDQLHTGQLMTRISSDVDLVRMFIGNGLALILRAALMIGGSLVMLMLIDRQLTLVVLMIMPLAGIIIWAVLHWATPLFRQMQRKLARLNTIVQENLSGALVVKAFVREPYEIERFESSNDAYMEQHIRVGRLMAVATPLLTLLTNLGLALVIWFGGLSTSGGRLQVGELVAFTNYVLIGMAPVMLLSNMLTMISQAETSAGRIWEVLDMQPAVKSPSPTAAERKLQGAVSFVDVSFHYDGDEARLDEEVAGGGRNRGSLDVLKQVSFSIRPGQRVALLGATGSGKSSLVNLIPRFYDVDSGVVQVDETGITDWHLPILRRQIGVVLQETTLFAGSVRDNIAYGRPEAPKEAVVRAAKIAQAHDFIMRMPQGYESDIAARGANLSGGQKQRIAIARALLIAPRILILDDSTSAVDMETEAKIQAGLNTYMQDRTTFVVAQRISSVLNADLILVMDRGQIVAQGTHKRLLQSNAIYQEIYYSQLGSGPQPPMINRTSTERGEP